MAEDNKNSEYVLSRDYVDCTRLNMQHTLWTQIFGYLLHPKIDVTKKGLKVADVGTGTGKWLMDLSYQVAEDSRLDGFDCDLSQAPPRAWVPRNVILRKWDMLTKVPEDMVGVYDVVHVRLLVFVVKGDPNPLLENLLKMLKPGGWLQWSEPDVPSVQILKANPANKVTAIERLFRRTAAQDPRLIPTWPSQLDDTFKSVGLEEVELQRVNAEPHLEYSMHQCNLLIYEMIARYVGGSTGVEIMGLIPEAAAETKHGAMISFSRIAAVGRKPLK